MVAPSAYGDVYITIGPHKVTLIDAINDWSDRVLKLLFDSRSNVLEGGRSAWGLYDLVASLVRRDAIEGAINNKFGKSAKLSVLKAADELFISFTRPIPFDVANLAEEAHEPHDLNWWWGRIPSTGPIAIEAEVIIQKYF